MTPKGVMTLRLRTSGFDHLLEEDKMQRWPGLYPSLHGHYGKVASPLHCGPNPQSRKVKQLGPLKSQTQMSICVSPDEVS